MAQRRMFSLRIVNSARFLKMPNEAQVLYFHMCMDADDDGIVEAYTVLKKVGVPEDNFKVLIAKGFIVPLNEDDVAFITDWKEHNLIRADRKIDSIYKSLLVKVVPDVQLLEVKPRADTGKPTGRPVDNQWTAQVRLGKVRLLSDSEESQDEYSSQPVDDNGDVIEPRKKKDTTYRKVFQLWGKYPLNWNVNRTEIDAAKNILEEHGLEKAKTALNLWGKYKHIPDCPQILKPSDLDRKWVNLVAFGNRL